MNQLGMYQTPLNNYYQNLLAQQLQGFPMPGYPQPAPAPAQPVPQTQYYAKPVGNVEEAKGYSVDPGCQCLFIDKAKKSIYLKYMANDGTSRFETYALQTNAQEESVNPFTEVNQRLAVIESILGGMANAKYVADDSAACKKPHAGATAGFVQPTEGAESTEIPKHNGNDERQGRERSQGTGGEYRKGQGR